MIQQKLGRVYVYSVHCGKYKASPWLSFRNIFDFFALTLALHVQFVHANQSVRNYICVHKSKMTMEHKSIFHIGCIPREAAHRRTCTVVAWRCQSGSFFNILLYYAVQLRLLSSLFRSHLPKGFESTNQLVWRTDLSDASVWRIHAAHWLLCESLWPKVNHNIFGKP